jgi:hypothetical protein
LFQDHPVVATLIVLCVIGGIAFVAWQKRETKKRRHRDLVSRFGEEIAAAILRGEFWQGATREMLIESRGHPTHIKESVLKDKIKHTYCYNQIAKNRYALRVHLEDRIVVGWEY